MPLDAELRGCGGSHRVVPLFVWQANQLVKKYHRHHRSVQGGRFAVGLQCGKEVVGAVIVGRPVSRRLQEELAEKMDLGGASTTITLVAEATRCVVKDGHPNAASKLYAAARRVTFSLGFRKLLTYTLRSETGISLRAAGWLCDTRPRGGGSWNRKDRERVDRHPTEKKLRWFVENAEVPA